jgi:hypothetical protein
MSFVHGSGIRVMVNEKEVSSEVSGATVTHQRAVSEVTCVGQTPGAAGSNFIPGLMSGTLAVRGPQGSDHTIGLTKEIQDAIGVDNDFMATVLPDTVAVGKPAMFIVGDPTEYAVDSTVADAVAMTMTAQADESVELGWVLAPLQAYTADALTGTAVDRGASPLTPTTRGLVAAIHVTAFSGFTGVVVKVQHSTDNSTWADLATFTTVTAVGRERVKVANGTTVNRYLRASVDVTGSGSITLIMVAAPR